MNIYTENDLKNIISDVAGTDKYLVTKPLCMKSKISEENVKKIVALINYWRSCKVL